MKTNLRSYRNPPAVAFANAHELVISFFLKGQFHSIRLDLALAENQGLELPIKQRKNTKLVIVLSDQLVFYSRLKLPLNLSDQEVAELIELELQQRGEGSDISTYYDYYLMKESDDNAIFSLFEARKDKLNLVIDQLQSYGFNISIITPQTLVILNQIIKNNNLTTKTYQIICRLDQQILLAHINDERLVELTQIHLDPVDIEYSIYAQLQAHLQKSNCKNVISLGLRPFQPDQQNINNDINLLEFESLIAQDDLTTLTINWMREQYDLYQSVAMA